MPTVRDDFLHGESCSFGSSDGEESAYASCEEEHVSLVPFNYDHVADTPTFYIVDYEDHVLANVLRAERVAEALGLRARVKEIGYNQYEAEWVSVFGDVRFFPSFFVADRRGLFRLGGCARTMQNMCENIFLREGF